MCIRDRIRGLDSDNGSEFINAHLLAYCEQEELTFTRSRSGNKNDGAYVEQKNWSVVRRAVGYHRYDTPAELDLLNNIYALMRRQTNFFSPQQKLVAEAPPGRESEQALTRDQGRVHIQDHDPTQVGVRDPRGGQLGQLCPHVSADPGPGHLDPLQPRRSQLVQRPTHRRRRRHRPEHLVLMAQHVDAVSY